MLIEPGCPSTCIEDKDTKTRAGQCERTTPNYKDWQRSIAVSAHRRIDQEGCLLDLEWTEAERGVGLLGFDV